MRVPDNLKKCVVFLGVEETTQGGEKRICYRGTAFFAAFPSVRVRERAFVYLVTAKHVSIELERRPFFIRGLGKDGKPAVVNCAENLKWFHHPNDSVADISVFAGINEAVMDRLDFQCVPFDVLLAENKRQKDGIGVGDEVFVVGLFAYHYGTERNMPIIRMGNIAMIPEEPIPTSFGSMDAYLIEARSIGGLSGSPVFVVHYTSPGEGKIYLLGLIHGHWDVRAGSFIDATDAKQEKREYMNVGIAMITPAQKLIDTIHGQELEKVREWVDGILVSRT